MTTEQKPPTEDQIEAAVEAVERLGFGLLYEEDVLTAWRYGHEAGAATVRDIVIAVLASRPE